MHLSSHSRTTLETGSDVNLGQPAQPAGPGRPEGEGEFVSSKDIMKDVKNVPLRLRRLAMGAAGQIDALVQNVMKQVDDALDLAQKEASDLLRVTTRAGTALKTSVDVSSEERLAAFEDNATDLLSQAAVGWTALYTALETASNTIAVSVASIDEDLSVKVNTSLHFTLLPIASYAAGIAASIKRVEGTRNISSQSDAFEKLWKLSADLVKNTELVREFPREFRKPFRLIVDGIAPKLKTMLREAIHPPEAGTAAVPAVELATQPVEFVPASARQLESFEVKAVPELSIKVMHAALLLAESVEAAVNFVAPARSLGLRSCLVPNFAIGLVLAAAAVFW